MFDLKGKKALVTGGSRGIGRGIVLALAQQGAAVAVNYRSSEEEATETVGKAEVLGVEAWPVQADVSQKNQVAEMFNEIKMKWGGLDVLVNNAGIIHFASFEELTEEQWDQLMAVNLKGQFLCAQEALKLMKSGSKIVNIASIASGGVGIGFSRVAHYTASKGGVVALTENMALDLGPKGINVNAVAPGVIDTDMTTGMLSDEQAKKALLTRIPKGRVGKPEDIGSAVAYLASDEADYVTGIVLYVDGGWLAG